jgi:hypothetical protein
LPSRSIENSENPFLGKLERLPRTLASRRTLPTVASHLGVFEERYLWEGAPASCPGDDRVVPTCAWTPAPPGKDPGQSLSYSLQFLVSRMSEARPRRPYYFAESFDCGNG